MKFRIMLVSPLMDMRDWLRQARCVDVDPEIFFEEKDEARALAVCNGCSVRRQCGGYARLEGENFGVWGGLNSYERNRKRLAYFRSSDG
jgi:WhiB family redox-sensing transcriptional regulator